MTRKIGLLLFGASLSPFAHADSELYTPRSLDGVPIEAVEAYPNPRESSVGLGLGIYPFNPYYSALLVNGTYLKRMNRTYQWELLNVSYAYTFDKSLTNELAESYDVEPKAINRLQFIASSNLLRTLAQGKFIFMDDHIRYFQFSGILGAGLIRDSKESAISANLGIRTEVFTSDRFSWRLDVRDQLTIGDFEHRVTFVLSTGLAL